MKRRRLKVLPFQFPGLAEFLGEPFDISDILGKAATRIPAVIGRPGYYYDRKSGCAWHEFPDGSAWLGDPKRFLYEIHALEREEKPLTDDERKAIRLLLTGNRFRRDRRLSRALWDDDDTRQIKSIRRDARWARIQMLKGEW